MIYFIRYWSVTIFILSIIAISTALIAEFIFNFLPCKMCVQQRYPYYFIIIIFIFFYFFDNKINLWFNILTELAIVYGLFYSIWHVGIEQQFIQGPTNCSGGVNKASTVEGLKEEILNQTIVNCNEISWTMLGLSAATVNTVFLIFILLLNTIFIIKVYYEK